MVGVLLEADQHSEGSQDNSPHKRVLPRSKTNLNIATTVSIVHYGLCFIHTQTTTGDDVKDFAKQLKNKLTRKYRHKPPKKTYLDYAIETDGEEREERDTGESLVFNNIHTRISDMAQRY